MKKALLILILFFLGPRIWAGPGDALRRLDAELVKKAQYDQRKEARIDSLRKLPTSPGEERFMHFGALFDEYASYKYDSAYYYANRLQEVALQLGKKERLVEASCAKVFCLLSTGFFKEAFETAARIDTEGCPAESMRRYYAIMARINYVIADYNSEPDWRQGYIACGNAYSEKLLALLDQQSVGWHYHHADMLMKSGRLEESIGEFNYLMGQALLPHLRAIVASCLGWMHILKEETDQAIEMLAEAAICDIQSSTKENTALRMLADVLSRQGQIDRPTRYVRESFEDANFYNARLRKIEVGAVLPLIEQNRYDSLQRERNKLIISFIIALIILVASLGVLLFIRCRNRQLREAHSIIQQRNAQLAESDAIKTAYIGNSFYLNAEYIDKISVLYKTVDRMLVAHQYEELRRSVKESAIDKERDLMYNAFDTTFLKIFPSFVEEYNALFKEEDREVPQHGLSTEMRIFALIRLGITESERIAKFLDYSVHTINTYKTRVKNKSVIENEKFEDEIMKIGTK